MVSQPATKKHLSMKRPALADAVHDAEFFGRAVRLVAKAEKALQGGGSVQKMDVEATGGVWGVKDKDGAMVAVFKPCREEAGAKDPADRARKGVEPGEGGVREYAVSLLSSRAGLKCPATAVVELSHESLDGGPAVGSLQEYVAHESHSWDVGPGSFSTDDVHSVGVMDLLFLNTDRHGGNMLVEDAGKLVPIDHAYCLPGRDAAGETDDVWVEWLTWPQAKTALSEEMLNAIAKVDAEANARTLADLGFSPSSVRHHVLAVSILQAALQVGVVDLRSLARLFTRPRPTEDSVWGELATQCPPGADLPSAQVLAERVKDALALDSAPRK
jgi:hypothetical protein